jgi:tetratricopeptide (TPR) repeat protein
MIIDNVDDEITLMSQKDGQNIPLASLLPQSDHGAILVTTRSTDVARSLVNRQQDIINVSAMSDDEAVELLENKLGDGRRHDTMQFVKSLNCIPLAIIQAAAYINRLGTRMSVAKYLDELKNFDKRVRLLQKEASDMRRDAQAPNSILTTWQISFDNIRQKRPSAAGMLSFMSFFDRQGIPEFMIRHYTDKDGEYQDDLSGRCFEEEDFDFEEDMAVLRAFSLVNMTQREDEFEMHGLVQLAIQMWLRSTDTEEIWRRTFIQAMAQEFPDGEYANWLKCQTLFPHVLPQVGQQKGLNSEMRVKWASVLNNAGWYAWQQGLFAQAEDMVTKALEIQKDILGPNDCGTLFSTGLLGSILTDLGKYEEAESMNRQTLARREKVLGPEHPDTLMSMSNLAEVLNRQGKYEEAESMNRQTLAWQEKVLGPEHPDTLTSMSNLAEVLASQGTYEEAESMGGRTLAQREKVLGPEHPSTLTSMTNLALVLHRQSKYEEAESMIRQTLARQEKVLGPEHPDTLTSMSTLAEVLTSQGTYEEAELIGRQTLARQEKVLGPEHPSTLTSMNNLALVLNSQGKYEEAESKSRQALARCKKVLEPEYPHTLMSMTNLAEVLAS